MFSVTDYLQGTGAKGGPLITTTNKTVQSDLRLYSSDQNQTMQLYVFYHSDEVQTKHKYRLSQSASYFAGQCAITFQRMIEVHVFNGFVIF